MGSRSIASTGAGVLAEGGGGYATKSFTSPPGNVCAKCSVHWRAALIQGGRCTGGASIAETEDPPHEEKEEVEGLRSPSGEWACLRASRTERGDEPDEEEEDPEFDSD